MNRFFNCCLKPPAQAPSQTPAQMPAQAPEQTWHVAIDRNHQPNQLSTQEVMGLINTNEDSDILVWREKMANWDDARKMEDFKAPTFEKDIALTENKQQPTNVLINKVAEPSAVTPEATKPQEKVNPVEDLPLKKDAVLNSMHKMREQFKPQPKKSLASAETPKPKAPMKPSPSIKTTPFKM